MVKIKVTGDISSGGEYVLISKSELEYYYQLETLKVILDFERIHNPEDLKGYLTELYKELGDDLPKEFKDLIKRNPWAARYLKALNGRQGRPEALNVFHRDFIDSNTFVTARALYEHLRAHMGYKGSLKTVQNYLGEVRRGKTIDEQTLRLW